jgi:hypothetical protein
MTPLRFASVTGLDESIPLLRRAIRRAFAVIRLDRGLSPPSCRSCSAHNKMAGHTARPQSVRSASSRRV